MKVNSITGPIDTQDLGPTLMHEHILIANHTMRWVYPDWFDKNSFISFAVNMIGRAKKQGIKTIVDLTTFQLGRDVNILREVAEKSEIQIIACTGFYWFEDSCLLDKSEEFLAEILIQDIEKGMEGTNIKASIIKCASDKPGLTEFNLKLLKAAAIAQKHTGMPLATHSVGITGYEQMQFFKSEGVDLKHVIIGHLGDTKDIPYLDSIARGGCYLGLDRFGLDRFSEETCRMKGIPRDLSLEERVIITAKLKEKGYLKQLVFSHDACCFIDNLEGRENLGNPWKMSLQEDSKNTKIQFDYIHKYAVPALLQRGFTQRDIDTVMIDTPRNIFEGIGIKKTEQHE